MREIWTREKLKQIATKILPSHQTLGEALPEIGRLIGTRATAEMLRRCFQTAQMRTPQEYLAKPETDPESPPEASLRRLYELAKRGPLTMADVCDRLDLSPRRVRQLLARAKAAKIMIRVKDGRLGLADTGPSDRVQDSRIPPTVGKRQCVAVASDLHFGSRYCLHGQIKEFVGYAYRAGAREVLIPGDLIDGDYEHGKFEMTHMGLEEQARDAFDGLPRFGGLTYHAITGNHEWTFSQRSGVNVGQYLTRYFGDHGRKDLRVWGDRGAFLRLRGAKIHLWHPREGAAYASSYGLQKKVEGYAPGEKPHLLLVGHWHRYCHIAERGVHAFACPTFQGGGSAFSKSLRGSPAIGGMILSWDLTAGGTMRTLVHEVRSYFEEERVHAVA